jgi:hypothetical protein
MKSTYYIILLALCIFGCSKKQPFETSPVITNEKAISDDSLLTLVQLQTFNYFWGGAEPTSGMARERLHMDNVYPLHQPNIITSGGSGFGIMAMIVGIERGFITRQEGFERLTKIVDFLENADSFHGVWPHW